MIYLGSDHAGFELKQALAEALGGLRQDVHDLGAATLDPADDYPDFAFAVGEAVVAHPGSFGILVCGSAQGVCIAANKVKGVRAVAAHTEEEAARAREHNDANVLCLAGWAQDLEDVKPLVAAFLGTRFPAVGREERDRRRIAKITSYESR